MVKCLIRIKTTVNVHLCMINHCYRDVKVRVLSLGPRLLGKALGMMPLLPALPRGPGETSRASSRLGVPPQFHSPGLRPGRSAGKGLHFKRTGLDWFITSVTQRKQISVFDFHSTFYVQL